MVFQYNYPRPMLTVDAVVFKEDKGYQILLIKRKNPPFKGDWALPGGFVDNAETAEQAVVRELKEETGLELHNLKQFKTYSAVDRDPRDRVVSIVFVGKISNFENSLLAGDDAEMAQWFSLENMPSLAFDHKQIIEEVICSGFP